MDSYNLTHTGAELDSAVGRALEGFAAADAATKAANDAAKLAEDTAACLLYTSPSPRDMRRSRMPSSA